MSIYVVIAVILSIIKYNQHSHVWLKLKKISKTVILTHEYILMMMTVITIFSRVIRIIIPSITLSLFWTCFRDKT